MTKRRGDIGMYIEALLYERLWHQRDLANKTGLSCAFISEVLRGGKNFSPDTIDSVAQALSRNKQERLEIHRHLNYLAATFAGYYIAEVKP